MWLFVTSSISKTHLKNMGDLNLGRMGQIWVQNQVYCHFVNFGLFSFYIAEDDSLELCLTTSSSKTH